MTIGDRVKVIRKEARLTQKEFGDKIAVRTSSVCMIERGSANITDRTKRDICNAFRINMKWLETGEGEMHMPERTPMQMLIVELSDILNTYPAIAEFVSTASERMDARDWKRLNELLK